MRFIVRLQSWCPDEYRSLFIVITLGFNLNRRCRTFQGPNYWSNRMVSAFTTDFNYNQLFETIQLGAKYLYNIEILDHIGHRRRKWTQRHEFKFWTKLIVFHLALIPLDKKALIQLFSFQRGYFALVRQTE